MGRGGSQGPRHRGGEEGGGERDPGPTFSQAQEAATRSPGVTQGDPALSHRPSQSAQGQTGVTPTLP